MICNMSSFLKAGMVNSYVMLTRRLWRVQCQEGCNKQNKIMGIKSVFVITTTKLFYEGDIVMILSP